MSPLFLLFSMLQNPPTITLTGDDTKITASCRIVIAPETVIEDANGDGVIHIAASNIVVEFAEGSVLRGSPPGRSPAEYAGYGIRIDGQTGVTLKNVRAAGFLCAIWGTGCDALMLEDCAIADIRRHHLKSTPAAEDGGDWLWPHKNDEQEWRRNYGGAICIESAKGVTVRRCRVRDSQNGLILDRVSESKIYDNDFSFLSGWGVAMWRSSRNLISRNALDFCVRGYSHGVYNRGQDSAGFLVFEQCSGNVFAENSATHGGDGFFGFAGREAIGEAPPPAGGFDYKRRGCNDNLLIGNDFSYAPAHGIEMTFSFGNRYINNRLVENAICGVWGGYSQDTLIAGNEFGGNGEMGYGLERGGVNIEHGRNNRVIGNRFSRNRCGVHLWWDEEGDFLKKPWGAANGSDSKDNLIAGNTFGADELVFHFRGPGDVTIGPNTIRDAKQDIKADETHRIVRSDQSPPAVDVPPYEALGESRPVGARPALRGRDKIIMTEWGPWDHAAPLVRLVEPGANAHVYEVHKLPGEPMARLEGRGVKGAWDGAIKDGAGRYVVSADAPGVHPYTLQVRGGEFVKELRGTLVAATWNVAFFPWKTGGDGGETIDPREDLDAWRALATKGAVAASVDRLAFKFSHGGPANLKVSDALKDSGIGGNHFGLIAKAVLPLTRGKWRLTTLSDDGVRVLADGKPIIENWTWHTPTRDSGVLDLDADRTVELVVEYFEIDGFAVLEFEIAPAE